MLKNPLFSKIISAIIHVLIGYLIVETGVFQKDANSQIDTYAFIFWTIPLALGISAFSKTMLYIIRGSGLLKQLVFIALVSILLAIGWQGIVGHLLGPVNSIFDQSVVYAWAVCMFLQLLFLQWRLPKETEKREASTVVLGILFLPMTVIVSMLGMNMVAYAGKFASTADKETYLIPTDFKGEFRIVYGEKGGQNPPVENGRKIFRIPKNGVLVVQSDYKPGTINHEYYLVDKKGNRKPLKMIEKYNQRVALAPGVLFWGSGSIAREHPSDGNKKKPINYTEFTLYRKDTKERNNEEYIQFQHSFDSLTNVMVEHSVKK